MQKQCNEILFYQVCHNLSYSRKMWKYTKLNQQSDKYNEFLLTYKKQKRWLRIFFLCFVDILVEKFHCVFLRWFCSSNFCTSNFKVKSSSSFLWFLILFRALFRSPSFQLLSFFVRCREYFLALEAMRLTDILSSMISKDFNKDFESYPKKCSCTAMFYGYNCQKQQKLKNGD